ncbi:MAG TPA: NAD(P)-dependent oxidoreductase [Roseiflexaceae bacterium]|nr:NAD(P)-dependent oxidoreductase [Roseiflexaceae bacterium]
MERIGFVGLGRMGQAMAGRLLDAGFPLTVHNRTRSRAEPLLARGAAWAGTPAELAGRSDLVLTILTDDRAVERVYSGPDGLLSGDVAGRLLVEMSTIRPRTIHTLRPLAEARGARLLDSPVTGTVGPARQGQLVAMVGGDATDLERARPALDLLARQITHCGPSGAGTTMKLVVNLPMVAYWAGLSEALALGRQSGLDLELMLKTMLESAFAPPSMHVKAPLLLGQEHEVSFDVTGVRKDALAMIATGQDLGVPMPAASAALALFANATAAGYGERDLVFVAEYAMEMVRKSFGE